MKNAIITTNELIEMGLVTQQPILPAAREVKSTACLRFLKVKPAVQAVTVEEPTIDDTLAAAAKFLGVSVEQLKAMQQGKK